MGSGQDNLSSFNKQLYETYLNGITHRWLAILYITGIVLNPLFILLDYFTISSVLFPGFVTYRLASTLILILVYLLVKASRPSRYSILYGHLFSMIVVVMIAKMTEELGGFNSSYYAGMNLVVIGVNVLLPWKYYNSAINGILTIAVYVGVNLLDFHEFDYKILINNLYFLSSTAIATVIINHVHNGLIEKEYLLRLDLHQARDALWGEMEIAKKIQISLLPHIKEINNYKLASVMIPADEVGGDYYDVIKDSDGTFWVSIGDVSGHGVESGLIMMMAQTAISSTIQNTDGPKPSAVLVNVNRILSQNIQRLNVDRYMTLILMHVLKDKIIFSGRHLDFMVYRHKTGEVEIVSEHGTYMGLFEDITSDLIDSEITIESGDIILQYTDGITEAFNAEGEMFGYTALKDIFLKYAGLPLETIIENIIADVENYQHKQLDDLSLFIMKKD